MNVRTKENCDKYREYKAFVLEYEKTYRDILNSKSETFDSFVWDNRWHIMRCRNALVESPSLIHLHRHIAEYQRQNIDILGIRYLGWLPF